MECQITSACERGNNQARDNEQQKGKWSIHDIPNCAAWSASGIKDKMRTARRTVITSIVLAMSEPMARRTLLLHPAPAPVEQVECGNNNYEHDAEQEIVIHAEVRSHN